MGPVARRSPPVWLTNPSRNSQPVTATPSPATHGWWVASTATRPATAATARNGTERVRSTSARLPQYAASRRPAPPWLRVPRHDDREGDTGNVCVTPRSSRDANAPPTFLTDP